MSGLYDVLESGLIWGAVVLIVGLMAYLAFLQVETMKARWRRRRRHRMRRAAAARGCEAGGASSEVRAEKDR